MSPSRSLLKNSKWLFEARGKAVKIVVPLLAALPLGLACRVILCERDLDEVLDSQESMLEHNGRPATTPERREILKGEYLRSLNRVKAMLYRRPNTLLLVVDHSGAFRDSQGCAEKINNFLGGGLDVAKMAGGNRSNSPSEPCWYH